MVGTLSALGANDSQEDLVVHRSESGEVFRAEGLRHTPVQQCLNHLGPQHADFQAKHGGRHIIQLRAETFAPCPHEMDLSFDFEREVGAFVNNAAHIRRRLGRLSIPMTSCFDGARHA